MGTSEVLADEDWAEASGFTFSFSVSADAANDNVAEAADKDGVSSEDKEEEVLADLDERVVSSEPSVVLLFLLLRLSCSIRKIR